jgi:hypothetical protein
VKKRLHRAFSTTLKLPAIAHSFLALGVLGLLLGVVGQVTSVEGIRVLGAVAVLIGTGTGCILTLMADRHDRSPAMSAQPSDTATVAAS